MDEAKREMEEELYKKLDEDCGKTLILKMKMKRYGGRDVHSETTGGKET